MIYVFKDTELLRTVHAYLNDVHQYNCVNPKAFPTDSYLYCTDAKKWYVKRTRKHVRSIPEGMVPKKWKTMLLLLGVPQ